MESADAKIDATVAEGAPDPARVTAARLRLVANRETVTRWAARNGENRFAVYKVLSGNCECSRGDRLRIARKLGIKDVIESGAE